MVVALDIPRFQEDPGSGTSERAAALAATFAPQENFRGTKHAASRQHVARKAH
jgi:hypothetical protein